MHKTIPLIAILIVLIYAVYNAKFRDSDRNNNPRIHTHYKEHIQSHKTLHYVDELSHIHTDEYTKEYIIKVINFGSNI